MTRLQRSIAAFALSCGLGAALSVQSAKAGPVYLTVEGGWTRAEVDSGGTNTAGGFQNFLSDSGRGGLASIAIGWGEIFKLSEQVSFRAEIEGQFRDTGLHELNGRDVRRLVGIVEVRGETARTKEHPEPRATVTKEQVEYDVDPETFTPIQMRQQEGVPGTPGYEPYMAVWDFQTFEWLPLTKDNVKLLSIQPAPGTKVTTETVKQFRARMGR